MYDILIIICQYRFASVGFMVFVIVSTAVKVEYRGKDKCNFITLVEAVNLTADVEEKVTFKGDTCGSDEVDLLGHFMVGV
eukprot:9018012-Ditylum_brightwellii.AAC.1